MNRTFHSLEQIIRRAPLGIRAKDLVNDADVTDGLDVFIWPVGGTPPGQLAARSPVSGIYGYRTLPGLRDYETGAAPATDWCDGDDTPNFILSITDRAGRYLPQVIQVCLPRTEVFEVPLYSSPARSAVAGYGVVRGEIYDQSAGQGAGWALVSATHNGATYATVADARGMFALFLPYPPLESAPDFGSAPVYELSWPFTFAVLYAPDAQEIVPGTTVPHTASIVGQGAATVFDATTTSGATVTRDLVYRTEHILLTSGDAARLRVTPA